jgi:hypothetical protein
MSGEGSRAAQSGLFSDVPLPRRTPSVVVRRPGDALAEQKLEPRCEVLVRTNEP